MEFFFNELSIHNQFQSVDDFKAAIHQFRKYREVVKEAGLRLYIHRNIYKRPIRGITFRKGIQRYFQKQQVKTLMNWLSKDGFFLPDDSFADSKDQFVCYFPEGDEEKSKDVTGSALAECAYRTMVGEEAGAISDSSSNEKRDFKGALTFDIDGEQHLCPYHGKVKIQQYRIHIVDRPAYKKLIRVVYIGPKLTKR